VGYRELLAALEDEIGRQIRQIEADADERCRRLDAEVHGQLAARREAALAAETRRLEEAAERAIGRARVEQVRTLLVEQRRLLAEIRQEAERRLAAPEDGGLAARLVDEMASELGDGPVELRVSAGTEAAFVSALAERHPELARRATVVGVDGMGGGVVAALDGGRQLIDNALPSRLDRAWQQMEGELATALFGDLTDDGRM